jgi:aldehyde dehydrogenase (NAD(P)+)
MNMNSKNTDNAVLDQAVAMLGAHKDSWAALPIPQKIDFLIRTRYQITQVLDQWIAAATEAKQLADHPNMIAEEWIAGPWALLFWLNGMEKTLTALANGQTRLPAQLRRRPDGQLIVNVFPTSVYDRLLLSGFHGEVWMQPGVNRLNLAETMAVFYKQPTPPSGKVALVLGAGNVASIAPLDVLYKLYAEGQVCVLKMNPVNDYLGPIFEQVFAPFIMAGYVTFAYGDAAVGAYLATHPGIDEIHMTGSIRTHDAIVFGTGEEGAARKQRDESITTKRISSELGNVSPTIIVPGPWTAADLRYQAEHFVTQKYNNNGFNCIAAQVLVMPQAWPLREAFLDAIRQVIRELPTRAAYYPGAAQRQADALARHPNAEQIDPAAGSLVSRTLITGLDATDTGEFCFREESFGVVIAETALPGQSAAEFLMNAARFCNDVLFGTLGATVIIHPATQRALGSQFEDFLATMRYGAIGVNAWSASAYLLSNVPWGAYPGHSRNDIQSGVGVVHNTLLFDKSQKSVIYQPFYPFPHNLRHGELHFSPKPAWFVTNKQARALSERLTAFEADPNFGHLPRIFALALRG